PLIIGLTIVGFGTSAPEMLVSAVASWQENPGLAIGNAIGSNITNIALILGATSLIAPLSVHSSALRREFPVLLLIMFVALGLMLDGELGRMDGALLGIGLGAMLIWLVRLGMRDRRDPMQSEFDAEIPSHMPMLHALLWLVLGFAVLVAGSRLLVWGAVNVAQAFGISDLVIGLTIVALGTSLPELAVSVMSALKKEHDIAMGNVIGSNMFNLLGVLAMPGLIAPGLFPPEVLTRDFPVMIGLTLMVAAMGYGLRGPGRINRLEGAVLLCAYIAYQTLLYFALFS
ncbi:MAG: calcium/sodium antiporter, partial [Mariprofundaceae bacterium]|nr:calcium/sodium antiporter [Mariprofundaceae bacterium]